MPDKLHGRRILILETREEAQFSKLLQEQGADVVQCPMFVIIDSPDAASVEAWIWRFIDKPCDDLVLMTGEGLRRIVKVVRRTGAEPAFVAALAKPRKFARGPKPVRALRELGLEAQVVTEKPTSDGIAETLGQLDLQGHRLGIQLYPEQDHGKLLGAIKAMGAEIDSVLLRTSTTPSCGGSLEHRCRDRRDGGGPDRCRSPADQPRSGAPAGRDRERRAGSKAG